jgi:hypothetical protein
MFGWMKKLFGVESREARWNREIEEARTGTVAMARAMEEQRAKAKVARIAKAPRVKVKDGDGGTDGVPN